MVLINRPSFYHISVPSTGVHISEDSRRKFISVFHEGAETVYVVSKKGDVVADSGYPIVSGVEWSADAFNCQGGFWLKTAVNAVTVDVMECLAVAP